MATQTSVLTAERFASGWTYQDFIANTEKNHDRFQENYDGTEITDADVAAFKELMARPNGPAKVAGIVVDWCPDVYRGLPPMVKLCEKIGLEFKMFERDQNLDIMNEFLKNGEFQSVPVFIFYTKNHDEILHWIERAAKADEEMPLMRAVQGDRTREEAADDIRAFQRGPVWAGWRRAEIDEIREMLDRATAR